MNRYPKSLSGRELRVTNAFSEASTITVKVSAYTDQGTRRTMEDRLSLFYGPEADNDDQRVKYVYAGVFDGHGGTEAATYTKEHLLNHIRRQPNFLSNDDNLMLEAIRNGFLSLHEAMQKEQVKWPRTLEGYLSTAGTTASIVFIYAGKVFIGHVGDSRIVLGEQADSISRDTRWRARPLTEDHKPENTKERIRIYQAGGKVFKASHSIHRVGWMRYQHTCGEWEEKPFLSVARSLGDYWSFNSTTGTYVVSPKPDVHVVNLNPMIHRCIVLASDGLWDALTSEELIQLVQLENSMKSSNLSEMAIKHALRRKQFSRSDNITAIIIMIDYPSVIDHHSKTVEEGSSHQNIEGAISEQDVSSSDGDTSNFFPYGLNTNKTGKGPVQSEIVSSSYSLQGTQSKSSSSVASNNNKSDPNFPVQYMTIGNFDKTMKTNLESITYQRMTRSRGKTDDGQPTRNVRKTLTSKVPAPSSPRRTHSMSKNENIQRFPPQKARKKSAARRESVPSQRLTPYRRSHAERANVQPSPGRNVRKTSISKVPAPSSPRRTRSMSKNETIQRLPPRETSKNSIARRVSVPSQRLIPYRRSHGSHTERANVQPSPGRNVRKTSASKVPAPASPRRTRSMSKNENIQRLPPQKPRKKSAVRLESVPSQSLTPYRQSHAERANVQPSPGRNVRKTSKVPAPSSPRRTRSMSKHDTIQRQPPRETRKNFTRKTRAYPLPEAYTIPT